MRRERQAKIAELKRYGLLRSERLRSAMLHVAREDFVPPDYRDHAYEEIPLPLPGERATISCPHSYPLFYEPLGLGEGHRFLEVGVGSGYGTALVRAVVGREGLVVGIEIDAATLAFAREKLDRAGYTDVVLVHGDGGHGYLERAPYDRICVTAACPDIPPPLIEQLEAPGRLIAPSRKARAGSSPCSKRSRPACAARSSRTSCTSPFGDDTAVAAVGSIELSADGHALCFVGKERGRSLARSRRHCDGPSHATCAIRARARMRIRPGPRSPLRRPTL